MNQISINIQDHHLVPFLVVFLYLLILIRQNKQNRFRKILIYFAGTISILMSYDIIVPLFGKIFYMKLLSLSFPAIITFSILLVLVIISLKQPKKI